MMHINWFFSEWTGMGKGNGKGNRHKNKPFLYCKIPDLEFFTR